MGHSCLRADVCNFAGTSYMSCGGVVGGRVGPSACTQVRAQGRLRLGVLRIHAVCSAISFVSLLLAKNPFLSLESVSFLFFASFLLFVLSMRPSQRSVCRQESRLDSASVVGCAHTRVWHSSSLVLSSPRAFFFAEAGPQ